MLIPGLAEREVIVFDPITKTESPKVMLVFPETTHAWPEKYEVDKNTMRFLHWEYGPDKSESTSIWQDIDFVYRLYEGWLEWNPNHSIISDLNYLSQILYGSPYTPHRIIPCKLCGQDKTKGRCLNCE